MDESHDPREELVRHHRWLRRYGLNDSHSGNASVRDGATVWVTPSGCSADRLEADDLVACSLADGPGEGASLDAPLHLAVYRANPAAGAVLHSHGPHAIALTLDGEDFMPVDFEGRYYFERVPVVDAGYDGYLEHSPRLVAEALARNPVAIYRGHGVYAWGETVDRAYKWSCSVELSAHIAHLAKLTRLAGRGR